MTRATTAQAHVVEWLGEDAGLRLSSVKIKGGAVDVRLSGSGTVPDIDSLERVLSEHLGDGVEVRVELFPAVILTSDARGGARRDEAPQSTLGIDHTD